MTIKFDYAVLTDMFHYSHLDEEKLRAGLKKEMDAMTTFDLDEEVDANYVDQSTLQNAMSPTSIAVTAWMGP